MHELTTSRRIEFSDTDLGGIVHFSRFFIFMETAEEEFLRAVGASFYFEHGGRTVGFPKVAAACEYLSPARYGDRLEIRVRVAAKSAKTVTWEFAMRVGDREVARGRTTSVCATPLPGGGIRSLPLPDFLAERLETAPG